MILKDLMEEKQLNLNQPLLSVRRFSSPMSSERKADNSSARLAPIPSYQSELKSGPVRSAGNVPFVWEKVPGRPKDRTESHTQIVEKPPIAPNFPPGRAPMRCGSNVSNSQSIVESLDKMVTKASSDSDDDDETFLDALDTLSRTESFFMSSSVNGMSGLDDQEVQKSTGSLSSSSSDQQQARNFIIDRFLPAAKAMISETHQYAASSRKPDVGQEQLRQAKKVASSEKSLPLNLQQRPKTLPHCAQDKTDVCNVSQSYAATGCGLFPRLCLLNPTPGFRIEDNKAQGSAVHGMQGKAKSIASQSETAKEHARTPYHGKKLVDSDSGFAEEKDILCVSEKSKHGTDQHHDKGCSKVLTSESTQHESSCKSPIVEKTLYVDSVRTVKPHSSSSSSEMKCQTIHKGDSYKNPSNESSLENAALQPKSLEPLDSPFLVCSENTSNDDMKMEITRHSKKLDSEKRVPTRPSSQGSDLDKNLVKKKIALKRKVCSIQKSSDIPIENPETAAKPVDKECTHDDDDDGKIDLESQCLKKLGHQETPTDASYLQVPLELPSLKAPSESWLKRTLPTISSKNNMYSRPNHNSANICATGQAHKAAPCYPNWETVVKSSNVHHGYQQFPEVVLTTIPEA